ncbi:hypothetical protein DI53_3283 [Sphingobacterium deserti]|uniref:Uncharacterized protein n=2 Tax=Sphingobacterium deserti TaxID=1229276 RepID=A0A0B8SZN8_9SPHI|nr:hypothetical protein DI53_3283 [Sphingobacterium deserti]
MNSLGLGQFSQNAYGTIVFGAISGGVVAGLNHVMHRMDSPLPNDAEGEDPPGKKNANRIEQAANVGKEIGTSAELIEAIDKSLKGNSKVLGKFAKVGGYLSAGGQIIYDGVEYYNGEISGYRFSFRFGATVTSAVVGAEVGTAIGGPAGFVVGTTIGIGAGVTESAWDNWWPQFKQGFNGFINRATNNWMHYR